MLGRAVVAPQDDVDALRELIIMTATAIETDPTLWARDTAEWSNWFQSTYSREKEIAEICDIVTQLHGKR
jgi:hypothetical protein